MRNRAEQQTLTVLGGGSVGRHDRAHPSSDQSPQRRKVVRHVTLGRIDDNRPLTRHQISGDKAVVRPDTKGEMTARVPRRVEHFDRHSAELADVTRVEFLVDLQLPFQALGCRAVGTDGHPQGLFQRGGPPDVIGVVVGQPDRLNDAAAFLEQSQ